MYSGLGLGLGLDTSGGIRAAAVAVRAGPQGRTWIRRTGQGRTWIRRTGQGRSTGQDMDTQDRTGQVDRAAKVGFRFGSFVFVFYSAQVGIRARTSATARVRGRFRGSVGSRSQG